MSILLAFSRVKRVSYSQCFFHSRVTPWVTAITRVVANLCELNTIDMTLDVKATLNPNNHPNRNIWHNVIMLFTNVWNWIFLVINKCESQIWRYKQKLHFTRKNIYNHRRPLGKCCLSGHRKFDVIYYVLFCILLRKIYLNVYSDYLTQNSALWLADEV